MSRFAKALGVIAIAVTIPLLAGQTAYAAVPFNKPVKGNATYYDDKGLGACGDPIDASSQRLVAVPKSFWTSSNPNDDPLCDGVSVKVKYKNKTVTIPVKDQCPGCDAKHIDVSEPVFRQLTGGTDLGDVPVTWEFVRS
ncbi:cysteine/serine endopeptidase inhibitor [Kutzneria sp. CA-103260]|uniref:cysteine/serine endopeptidase inhibitor n=1 Tax=Kutzneria sp. CA-103260 TaxID=2802641 RepID=UPI001BA96380|nr:cysteine/serine endopeptidase inhibitor [Kutzneria sp. CA-103260]QUQ72326.1 Papain inhibitor [Kutzneria sp. CA-103260]